MDWLFVKRLRSFILLAAGVSLVLNVTLLMPAIYMMQVFDRVFASRSIETLTMLAFVAPVQSVSRTQRDCSSRACAACTRHTRPEFSIAI